MNCGSAKRLREGLQGGGDTVSCKAAAHRRASEHRMAWFTLTFNYSLISKEEKYSRGPLQAYSCPQLLLTPLKSWAKHYQQITISALVLTCLALLMVGLLNQDSQAQESQPNAQNILCTFTVQQSNSKL